MKELSPIDWFSRHLEVDEYYREVEEAFPALCFPPQWEVRIIPPFGGAMVRFRVKSNGREVSVYGDYYSALGVFGDHEPYWEMYPRTYIDDQDGHEYRDTERFPLDDAQGLCVCHRRGASGRPARLSPTAARGGRAMSWIEPLVMLLLAPALCAWAVFKDKQRNNKETSDD